MEVKESLVRGVFNSISDKYDLIDSIMSLGMDGLWRKKVVDLMNLGNNMQVLDSGAGSGKVSEEILKRANVKIDAVDITSSMFRLKNKSIKFHEASAENLPFQGEIFDRAVSCFLTRNLYSVSSYLHEVYRTLKPGGIFCNLDIYDPGRSFIAPLFRVYFYNMIPKIMDKITYSKSYSYLARSVKNFISPQKMTELLKNEGFKNINVYRLAGGTVYIHKAIK
ncbi:ubiquinone/menaquinone biosynthesis methyltransferase [Caldiplasma sukawensis]